MFRGADNGYLLTDRAFAGADTLATSYALSNAAQDDEERNKKKLQNVVSTHECSNPFRLRSGFDGCFSVPMFSYSIV